MGMCTAKETLLYERTAEQWADWGGPAYQHPNGDLQPVTKITAINGKPQFTLAEYNMGNTAHNYALFHTRTVR